MRRRTDQLDPSQVRLVIRPAANERREKGVVDVDDRSREARDEVVAQDLHVASEHDQIDPVLREQRELSRLLLALALFGDAKHRECGAELLGDGLCVRVVADDGHDLG